MPVLAVKRILALGNLLPRIRELYRKGQIDAATIRPLTLASRERQAEWLKLADDPDAYSPTGSAIKSWLFGGASIATKVALFDLASYPGEIVTDLFGEEGYFADAGQFWTAQEAAIEARKAAYLADGWGEVIVLPVGKYFESYDHERAPKKKGGRVYVAVSQRGEVAFHEGYLTRKEAHKLATNGTVPLPKPCRPEVSGPMQTYLDLHRHAAVRAALTRHTGVAMRLMVAHAVTGSSLWSVKVERQFTRDEATRESVETCPGETAFDERRREVLALLGLDPDHPTVSGGNGDDYGLTALFVRLLALPDAAVMDVIAIVMGETLAAGSAVIEAVGLEIGVDMASYWRADDAFFDLIRDREMLTRIVADVAGEATAAANAGEKGKTLKAIIRDRLDGTNGRAKLDGWTPKWMAFPPAAYTARGGVQTVQRHARIADLLGDTPEPQPEPPVAGAGASAAPEPGNDPAPERLAA